jgi:hypothetical protein
MSPKKSRKPLDNALAQQFIYGEKQHGTAREPALEETPSEPPPEQPSPTQEKTLNKSPLMNKFQTPPKEATVRLTVDLTASMHRKLSILAARTGKKKAEIVRVLLDEVLSDVDD